MTKLSKAARRAVDQALKIKKHEKVLLVTDKQKLPIAQEFARWAHKKGAEVTTYLMTETLRPISKPTALFTGMIRQAGVTIYMLDSRIEEKSFRGFMVKEGAKSGRILMMPGITISMMERLVDVNYSGMAGLGEKVIKTLKNCEDVHVTNPLGTDVTFSVKGRVWENDRGDISAGGSHGNLPAGEVYTAPVEASFTGKIVLSLIDDKLGRGTMVFKSGKLVEWKGRGISQIIKNIGNDPTGRIIGEFGIGTNKGAKICKNMLEAEKAFGTVHFAIGDSYGMGKNKSPHHYDALVEKVTLAGNGKTILKNGKFVLK
jgi:leucyl aminopeptidase (aminopeptidase T)